MKIPNEVQEAWNTVAKFLNKQDNLSFFVSPNSSDEAWDKCYTLSDLDRKVNIVADEPWELDAKEVLPVETEGIEDGPQTN